MSGTLNSLSGGTTTLTIQSGGYFEITETGTASVAGFFGSGDFTLDNGGTAVVNGTLTTQGGGGSSDVVINGTLTGSGTINAGGGISGTGTVNGQSAPFSNPLNVGSTGYEWDGTSWDPSEPNDPGIRAVFTGNYTDPGTAVFGTATIESGVSVSFTNREGLTGVRNDGTMILEDNCAFDSDFQLEGSGNIILRRTFNTVGWKHIFVASRE